MGSKDVFLGFSSKSQHRILRVIRNKGMLLRNKVRLLISRGGLLGDKAEMICEEGIHKTFTKHSQNEGKTEM